MTQEDAAYLAVTPWDIERWQQSRAFRRMSLAGQGAYRNLCDAAWKAQPSCELSLADRDLWRLAGARSQEEWAGLKAEVLDSDAWVLTEGEMLLNEVVLETYQESLEKHRRAVRSGRIAGKASAKARRALAQAKKREDLRTAVERSLNVRQPAVAVAVAVAVAEERKTTNGSLTAGAVSDEASEPISTRPPEALPEPEIDPPTNGHGPAATMATPTVVVREIPWSREACDDFLARYGGTLSGSDTGGQIGKFLKPLVTQHGWDVVRPAWRRYLSEISAQYVSPARFASTFGHWAGQVSQANGPPRKPTGDEQTVAAAARVAARHAARKEEPR